MCCNNCMYAMNTERGEINAVALYFFISKSLLPIHSRVSFERDPIK